MNGKKLLSAFSYIDDNWLSLAEGHKTKQESTNSKRFKLFISLAAAAVVLAVLSLGAAAFREFNSLNDDDLSLSAVYEGAGIVSVEVENRSDVDLHFQHDLKLQKWSTSEEIPRLSETIEFRNTDVRAGEKQTLKIDLSRAYDLGTLEVPLEDDWYVLILTNNRFLFGQDWRCSIDFSTPALSGVAEPDPLPPAVSTGVILESLRPYFASVTTNPAEQNAQSAAYLALCRELLAGVDGTVASPVCPRMLTIKEPEEIVIFDPSVSQDEQLALTGLHPRTVDAYGKKVGALNEDEALELSVELPQRRGEIDGVDLPLLYIFTYEADAIKSPQDYAFIRGRILTFDELESYKVYEDGQYICYDVTALFYSDLRTYVETIISQRIDVFFDEAIWQRVEKVYSYYTRRLPELIAMRTDAGEANLTR